MASIIGVSPDFNNEFEEFGGGATGFQHFHNRFTASDREVFHKIDEVLNWINLTTAACVIDIGAGSGIYVEHLVKRVSKVFAVDTSPNFVNQLQVIKQQKKQEWQKVEVVQSDQEKVPLPDAIADVIICVDVYHHFTNVSAMLNEMRRLLKKEGRIVIVDYKKDFSDWTHRHVRASKEQAIEEITRHGWVVDDELQMTQNWCIAFRNQ